MWKTLSPNEKAAIIGIPGAIIAGLTVYYLTVGRHAKPVVSPTPPSVVAPSVPFTPPLSPPSTPIPDTSRLATPPQALKLPTIYVLDSRNRRPVWQHLSALISDSARYVVTSQPIGDNWQEQCKTLGTSQPAVVIAHWHALRIADDDTEDPTAEEDLLDGLDTLRTKSPGTKFILYSRQFDNKDEPKNRKKFRAAIDRLLVKPLHSESDLNSIHAHTQLVAWHKPPTEDDKKRLQLAIDQVIPK